MLEILNRYSHGLASIPILHALRERGCLARLAETASFSAEELAREFSANPAYLDVALRMLVSLDWIRPVAEGRYEATPGLASSNIIPDQIMDLYHFPFDLYVQGAAGEFLEPWLERSERRWNSEHPYLPDYLDGLLIIPLLLLLRAQGRVGIAEEKDAGMAASTLSLSVDPAIRREITRLFVAKGWAAQSGDVLRLNRAGRFVIDRIAVTAVLASYRPMLGRSRELLFGDAARVFALNSGGPETHLDRTLNVIGSGFQHEKYFVALSEMVVRCFDTESYSSQPKYIADMGCGDGSLLRRMYETVLNRTRRGKVLDRHPLILIAVDYNDAALAVAAQTLHGLEHVALKGDIGDPLGLQQSLRAHGVEDLDRVLHVRSFLDHDRPYREPEDRKAAERRSRFGASGIYIDTEGRAIPPGDLIQSTVEHLRRWSQVVNAHGLVVLEVHCLPPAVTARYLDESESFHFDASQSLSHQYLLEAETFLACAAEAGLFCHEGLWRRFPNNLPFTRITLNHFEKRPYSARHAQYEDLTALLALRKVWPLSETPDQDVTAIIEARLRGFPQGQFVLRSDAGVMAFVSCDRAQDGSVRLISAYVSPTAPTSRAQDLFGFVEQYWALKGGIGHVSGAEEFRSAMSTSDHGQSLARLVAGDVAAKVVHYQFAAADDPRLGERELGNFCFRWLLTNLQRMGVMREPGETYELEQLKHLLGVASKYDRYFAALVRRLEAEGLVLIDGRRVETTTLVRGYALTALQEQVTEFQESFRKRYPACTGLLNLTATCLSRYEEIITGQIDVAEIVFPGGEMDLFAELFRGDPAADYFNRMVAEAVRSAVVQVEGRQAGWMRLAPFSKVRVLEIGAGPFGTTSAVLEAIEPTPNEVEFHISDISPAMLRYAQRRFVARYPWVEYRILDIEEDLSRQGFRAHDYDVILAANVLHDTRNIERVLEQVRRLLKPGGLLVLSEYTSVKDCLLFSGALLQGYWLFQDPERRLRDSCLLGIFQWTTALEHAGFAVLGSHALPTQSLDAACSQSVMLCEALAMDCLEKPRVHEQIAGPTDHGIGPRKAEIVGTFVEQQVLALLGKERAAAYSPQRPLMDMVLDSIELVELNSLIKEHLGVKLSPMFLFEHETPEKMTAALSEMVSNQQLQGLLPPRSGGKADNGLPAITAATAAVVARAEKKCDDIAIVGVACRFPGGVASAESFWKLLESGQHGIITMPAGRWRWPAFIDLSETHKGIDKAGFLERIDEFDASFFRISPKEAKLMDPQQRLLLELSWEAVEDAGHRLSDLSGRKVGVFVGVCHGDYREVLTSASDLADAFVSTGNAFSLLANRLSFFYDFKGPSLAVDTACSSSLSALHDAVTAIRRGDCEQALVGSANLLCTPTDSISFYRAGLLSPTGTCWAFDEKADGYVRGEGGAMLLLKPLAMAVAEGDSIYGLVKGTAVNHGGQASSLTAPKPDAQAAVIEAAWQEADIALDSVGYIETHGTGTRLGDPVEIGGLIRAFQRLYRARGKAWPGEPHCGLGSVKSNVGHLEGAAGLAGLIKILMAIRHRSIPATLNFERLNPDIDLTDSPFSIAGRNQVWRSVRDERGRELPRCAGVSSFGFGGTNAHAVIAEYPSSRNTKEEDGPWLIPLSARNPERLLEQARRLLEFLEAGLGGDDTANGPRLAEAAYTLQVGREPMEERIAFVVRSRQELMAVLGAYIAGERTIPNCHYGHSEPRRSRSGAPPEGKQRQEVETSIATRDLAKLASLWITGVECDWTRLYGESKPQRVSLPTYPFAKERYWIEAAGGRPAADKGASTAILHPLLHRNTSDLSEQRYSSTFTGEEFFLAGHRIGGQRLLPAVAYLEMARAAVARAAGRSGPDGDSEARTVIVKNMVWLRPLFVGQEPAEVHIGLFPENGGEVGFEIYSVSSGSAQEIVHAQGMIAVGAAVEAPRLDVEALARRYRQGSYSAEACYAAFVGLGMEYGDGHRGIAGLHVEGDEVVARLSLPGSTWADRFILHPGLIDSGLQAVIGFALASGSVNGGRSPFLAFELRNAELYRACVPEMWAVVRRNTATGGVSVEHYDIDICDESGRVCVRLRGLSTRSFESKRGELLRYRVETQGEAPADHPERPLEPAASLGEEKASLRRRRWSRFSSATREVSPQPESAEAISIVGMSDMRARVRRQKEEYDIDLCDEYGRVSVHLRGWNARLLKGELQGALSVAAPAGGEVILTPFWERIAIERDARYQTLTAGCMAVIGGTSDQRGAIQQLDPEAKFADVNPDDTLDSICETIAGLGEIGHVVWIVPQHLPDSLAADSVIAEQSHGVLLGFRLIKAILAAGYGDRTLTWTILTTGVEAVHAEARTNPTHASVHGFMGSVANEYAGWIVRLIDLPDSGDWPWKDVFAVQKSPHENALVYREGRWYRQRLLPYRILVDPPKAGGSEEVYVIIGGHGGIGSAWSEILLRRSRVQLVWIGRRPIDKVLQLQLDRLAELGPAPLYISADATDREQLARARSTILQKFGRIDGLVHAAMVLQDQSFANMTEDAFRAALRPKIDGCVRLAQVFGQDALRFVLFFSSSNAFIKSAGQSNYVAGCTFEDSFARRMASEWPCRVHVINWGYWGTVGAAASERYESLMARKGLGSIELPAATRILDELLCGRVVQMVYLETSQRSALQGFDVRSDEWTTSFRETLPSYLTDIERVREATEGTEWSPSSEWCSAGRELDACVIDLLWSQLQSMGLFGEKGASCVLVEPSGKVHARFRRWLEHSIHLLEARGYLVRSESQLSVSGLVPADGASAWNWWERRKGQWLEDHEWEPSVQLVEAALHALPDILTGRRAAAEILFADFFAPASTPVFAKVARRGPAVRFCNDTIARTVAGYIKERQRRDPFCELRILELGAGTGSTTEAVLEAIGPYASCLKEYACTNISMPLLSAARRWLQSDRAYVTYQTFDVEQAADAQGIALDSYDLVIASNVLLATRDIRRTLRNAKAVLKTNGLLMLHEPAANTTLNHLTAGLLDAWWQFADTELRISGGPALMPSTWKAVLQQEGFNSVLFPAKRAHDYGHQVVVAESDGVVRQCLAPLALLQNHGNKPDKERDNLAETRATDMGRSVTVDEIMSSPRNVAMEYLLSKIRLRTAEALGLDVAKLDLQDRPFADMLLGELGMDSLSSSDLRNVLRQELGVDIPVQRIIGEKVHSIVDALYDELLIRRVSNLGGPDTSDDREIYIF